MAIPTITFYDLRDVGGQIKFQVLGEGPAACVNRTFETEHDAVLYLRGVWMGWEMARRSLEPKPLFINVTDDLQKAMQGIE